MIGLCTDSNSQLPLVLAQRYGVEVVPMTLVVDDREYLEGHDLDIDIFYSMFTDSHQPTVTFSEPSPGQFALAYDELIDRGCSQILSIHTSASVSGTLKAARLAAHSAPVPVRLIDSGTARFGVSCCVWAAAEALARGASVDDAAIVAETLAPRLGNTFIVSGLDLVRGTGEARQRSVLSLDDETVVVLARVDSIVDAVNEMARRTLVQGDGLRVAIGTAHRDVQPISDALADAIGEAANVVEVVHFRIGPSVGAETGPGTVGCVVFPS